MKRFSFLLAFLVGLALPVTAQLLPSNLTDAVGQFKSVDNSKSVSTSKSVRKRKRSTDRIISLIKIVGNDTIPSSLIQQELFFRVGDSYNRFKLNRAVQQIYSLGVFSSVNVDTNKGDSGDTIIFTVEESPIIGEVRFPGIKAVSENMLRDLLTLKGGDHLNLKQLRREIRLIENYYNEHDFYQVKVRSVETPDKDGDPLVFNIREGVIKAINVTGNYKTKDYVITREMISKVGDVLKQNTLQEDVRRVYNLNYFSELNPELVPSDNGYALNLYVAERESSGQVSFGGGYSPQTGFSLFTDLFWDNLAGTGQLIMLKGQFGVGQARRSTFQFKYHNPWMWDDRKSLTTKIWRTDGAQFLNPLGANNQDFLDEKRFGIEASFGIPNSYEFRTYHRFKYERIHINQSNFDYQVNSYALGFVYDTRDVKFNPRSGIYVGSEIEQSVKINDDSVNLTQLDLRLKYFLPTFERQTLAMRADIGILAMDNLPIQDQYLYLGYRLGFADTIRGYDRSDVIFGSRQVILGTEYRFLFNDTFSFVLFFDIGTAADSLTSISDDRLLSSQGVGVRFTIPGIGPLRLDAGLNREGQTRVQFNMGHAF